MAANATISAVVAALAFVVTCPTWAQEAEKLSVLGTEMLLKADGRKTNGAVAVVEATVPPGHGPPKHVHSREDESFYVIDGRFRIWHGEDVMEVGPGDVAFLPRNVPHTYQNIGGEAGRLLVTIVPAGLEGFFREVSKRGLSAPKDMQELEALAKEYGLQFLGPPPQRAK